jgi:uncharacterized membrane protein HdeD (DUF308 family)
VASLVRTSHDGHVDVRRTLRLPWIALANGTAIYVQYANTRQHALLNHLLEQDSQNRALWFHFALWAAIPALGIVLEVFHSRFAKWINLGYFTYFGVLFSVMGILNLPDEHAFISLLYGIMALIFGIVSYLLYCKATVIPVTVKS